uniref:Uncharacterized protein n=1 Tax=Ditylenchus dipsaci TaxID=166011 RepID=A0A915CVK9_9BILA
MIQLAGLISGNYSVAYQALEIKTGDLVLQLDFWPDFDDFSHDILYFTGPWKLKLVFDLYSMQKPYLRSYALQATFAHVQFAENQIKIWSSGTAQSRSSFHISHCCPKSFEERSAYLYFNHDLYPHLRFIRFCASVETRKYSYKAHCGTRMMWLHTSQQHSFYCFYSPPNGISQILCKIFHFYFLAIAVLVIAELDESERSSYYFKLRRNKNRHPTQIVTLNDTDSTEEHISVVGPSNPGASCYDSRLTSIINTGIQNYSHDMGALSKYILDQIVRARYSGSYLVHAEMINGQRQGLEWQSVTNGDLFQRTSSKGCYYHDTQTYLIVVRY